MDRIGFLAKRKGSSFRPNETKFTSTIHVKDQVNNGCMHLIMIKIGYKSIHLYALQIQVFDDFVYFKLTHTIHLAKDQRSFHE